MHPSRELLSTLFEGAPRFVDRLTHVEARGWDDLLDQAEEIALTMPEDEQIELLDAHPRIGAAPASVSALSYREQGYDHDEEASDLQERLDLLNYEYESKFGFRFVVFVSGRSRAEIADLMPDLLEAPRELEKERALREVVAIARSRLEMMREDLPA